MPSDPRWLTIALRELGVAEVPGSAANSRIVEYHQAVTLKATSDDISWCSSFVAWCMEAAGIPSTDSAAARSWLGWGCGLAEAQLGAVTVLSRTGNPALGHVGFWIAGDAEFCWLLGGNQSDAVTVARFAVGRMLGWRWPA